MSRKDSEKEDRPHYYSQFWLDVAAGRRVIGGPKPNEEEELEAEIEPHKVGGRTNVAAMSDGHPETIAHPKVEPEYEQEELAEPEPEYEDVEEGNEIENIVMPDATIDEEEIPDVDITPLEEEEEDFFDEEEEEEAEEDLDWGGRGRKKPKPGRQAKLPPKKPKRDRRSGY